MRISSHIRSAVFNQMVADLLESPVVQQLSDMSHHISITRMEHCLFVAYMAFTICTFLGWNARAAARGGLLHDLFFYEWTPKSKQHRWHFFTHAGIALKNAEQHFELTEVERNIILRHMWPLNPVPPRYKEAMVVCMADKICAVMEGFGIFRRMRLRTRLSMGVLDAVQGA